MKIFFCLFLILLFTLSSCNYSHTSTQETTSPITKSELSQTSHIDTHWEKVITHLSGYELKEFDILEKSSQWWWAKVFSSWETGMIDLIEVEYLWETGKRKIQYLLKNEKIVLITDEQHSYNMPIYWDQELLWEEAQGYGEEDFFHETKTQIHTNSYYLSDKEILLWKKNSTPQNEYIYKDANVSADLPWLFEEFEWVIWEYHNTIEVK